MQTFLPEKAVRWIKPDLLIIQSLQDKWQNNCIWRTKNNGDCKKENNNGNNLELTEIINKKLDSIQKFEKDNIEILKMDSNIHGWTRPRGDNSYDLVECVFYNCTK